MRNNTLFVIDPQNDFMGYRDGQPYQATLPDGRTMAAALPVPGAVEDMYRLTKFVELGAMGDGIDAIIVTLDTHEPEDNDVDIGHPDYWWDEYGDDAMPFTNITYQDFVNKKWLPYDEALDEHVDAYLKKVGFQTVWPRHCVDDTWGHEVCETLARVLADWERRTGKKVLYVRKGMNTGTEQYGAFEAAMPDQDDPSTQYNYGLLEQLRRATRVWVAGEAKSHCVKATVEQAVSKLAPEEVTRFALLVDCMSSVATAPGTPDFAAIGDAFVADMRSKGMTIAKASV